MTDRIKGFIVTLDADIRDDDVQGILDAIRHVRHVTNVAPLVTEADDYMARARVRGEVELSLHRAISAVLNPDQP